MPPEIQPSGYHIPSATGRELRVIQPPVISHAEIAFIEEEAPPEHCGIAVIIPKESKRLLDTLYLAGSGVAHRGSDDGVGILSVTDNGLKIIHADGTYQQALSAAVSSKTALNGSVVVETLRRDSIMPGLDQSSYISALHVRYGTHGDNSDNNNQPSLEIASDDTEASISHNGEYPGAQKIRSNLRESVSEHASDTILITKLLAQEISDGAIEGVGFKENWDRAFLKVYDQNPGAAAQFTFLREPKSNFWVAYFSRDMDGIRPMVEGRTAEGDYMFASESVAFDEIGGRVDRSLRAGEIVSIDSNGERSQLRRGQDIQNPDSNDAEAAINRLCVMEKIYFGRPDSLEPNPYTDPSEWRSYGSIRESIGRRLADIYGDIDLDFVVGVPKSGIPYAEGFGAQAGLPYRGVLVHDLNMRVFMKDSQREAMRNLARSKFKIDRRSGLRGAKIGVFDDTLIRGTEAPAVVDLLKNAGADEVHLFLGYPPYNHPCHLGMSTRQHSELAGYKFDLDPYKPDTRVLAESIGVTSINYLPPIDLLELTSLPGQKLRIPEDPSELMLANDQCGGCIFGIYPVGKDGERHAATSPTVLFDTESIRRVGKPKAPEFIKSKE